jgi:hypothetical protein
MRPRERVNGQAQTAPSAQGVMGTAAFLLLAQNGVQVAGENIQLKGMIRRSLVLEILPRQPQFALVQEISSFPNIAMAWTSDSDALEHLR